MERGLFKNVGSRGKGRGLLEGELDSERDPLEFLQKFHLLDECVFYQVDGIIKHEGQDELSTVEIDIAQIKQAKQSFRKLESSRYKEQPNLHRPSMKIIKQEDVRKTMDDHRRKVSAEDFDDYTEHIKQNGSIAMTVTPTMTNGDVEHLEEH